MKKVHKSWRLTLGTFLILLLGVGSYIYTTIMIIDLETWRKEYTDKIAELEYKLLNCRLNTMNEFKIEEIKDPKPIKDVGVTP